MKRFLLTAVAVALLLALSAGAARADTSVHANGKTYTPASTVAKYKTSDGAVPQVTIPQSVPYYATKPPAVATARVYDPKLKYVVWVPLAAAAARGWYVGHSGGVDAGLIAIAFVVFMGAAGFLVALVLRIRRRS